MKIGLITDSLGDLDLPAALDWIVAIGIEAVEISTGGWSSVPRWFAPGLEPQRDTCVFVSMLATSGIFRYGLAAQFVPLVATPWNSESNTAPRGPT